MITRIAAALLFGAVFAGAAEAQSFNCRNASTADEVTICQNNGLSALDERLSRLYARARSRLRGNEFRALEGAQLEWLDQRRRCGRNRGCIEASYRERIRDLQDY
jgi:uncharacterized protein